SNLVIMTDAIKDINNPNNLIKVYPVPSSGLITINMKGTGFENMEITDALGRQIYNQMLSPQLKDNTIHVDLSTLSDGVYILHINSQHGLLNRKIIIQK
ncbi:MAG TPA: T9SS type A sorting domain-containing protein, partial [Bacteroidia bacterium]|nr:T9SS type A sorting domain-containing protein [Bacteroidia bacterium]